jgi:hypothetical protein
LMLHLLHKNFKSTENLNSSIKYVSHCQKIININNEASQQQNG